MTKHIIVGTAGHIDHGKTALVKALTGIDADRLEEEKRRGITIDIGFAHLDLGNDLRLGFVDVPGHEKFVKNMLAGVGGIDLVLLVIAADESIMPQTREHFDICRLLDIPKGLVAITKTDMAGSEFVDLVKLEAEEYLAGSFLEGAPIVPVSSKTGEGIEDFRRHLEKLARAAEPKNSRQHFRLPIDRVFVMKGFGSVVTGTMVSGSLGVDSEVEILPDQRRVRVRGIEVHDNQAERALAGQRTAINLAGVDASSLHRGMVLAAAGKFQPSRRIDCSVDLLPSARPLKYGARVHFHAGAAEIEGRVYFLDRRSALKPSESAYTQVRFQDPLLVLSGDRFIIRQVSPVITIGGGVVLDNLAPRHRTSEDWLSKLQTLETGQSHEVLEALIRGESYGLSSAEIIARTAWLDEEYDHAVQALEQNGAAVKVLDSPTWLVHRDPFRAALNRVAAFLEQFHKQNPLLPGAPKEALRGSEFAKAPAFFGRCAAGPSGPGQEGGCRRRNREVAGSPRRLAAGRTRSTRQDRLRFRASGLDRPGAARAAIAVADRRAPGAKDSARVAPRKAARESKRRSDLPSRLNRAAQDSPARPKKGVGSNHGSRLQRPGRNQSQIRHPAAGVPGS